MLDLVDSNIERDVLRYANEDLAGDEMGMGRDLLQLADGDANGDLTGAHWSFLLVMSGKNLAETCWAKCRRPLQRLVKMSDGDYEAMN